VRSLLAITATALLCLRCTIVPHPAGFQPQPSRDGQLSGGRSQFNQSCGAACAAPVNASTGELLAPAATRAGQVMGKALEAAEILQGFITVSQVR
jgi:hypothetical protein